MRGPEQRPLTKEHIGLFEGQFEISVEPVIVEEPTMSGRVSGILLERLGCFTGD